jgi:hypothetical protein
MAHTPICPRCQRPILFPLTEHDGPCHTGVTAYLVHEFYGCQSGCCGHCAYLLDAQGDIVASHFLHIDAQGDIVASHFLHSHPHDDCFDDYTRSEIHSQWPWATIDYARCDVLDD